MREKEILQQDLTRLKAKLLKAFKKAQVVLEKFIGRDLLGEIY